jgi:hypothetical protein
VQALITLGMTSPPLLAAAVAAKSTVDDVSTLFEGSEERTFLGAGGEQVAVEVAPDPAEKAAALGRLTLTLAPFASMTGKGSQGQAFTSGSGGVPFDAAKLTRIQASLEKQGVTFVTGEQGRRLANALNGEAVYIPEVGRPGIIAWGPQPSRTAVVEELLHLGQHRRAGWGDVSGRVTQLEIEAQHRLLGMGQRLGWSTDEMAQIQRALKSWEGQ